MGTIIHKTLIVTGWVGESIKKSNLNRLNQKAKQLCPKLVSKIIRHSTNGEATFVVVSSGSKLGWDRAKAHNDALDELVSLAEDYYLSACIVNTGECLPNIEAYN